MVTEQDVTDWVLNWDVRVTPSEENASLLDMIITVDAPPWVDLEDGETEEALEVTLGVGAPAFLWESMTEDQREDSRHIARKRVYEELTRPKWLEYLTGIEG